MFNGAESYAQNSNQRAGKHLSGSGPDQLLVEELMRSVALLSKVGSHLGDKFVAVIGVLLLAVGIKRVLSPVSHNESGGGLANAGTASVASELGDLGLRVVVEEHVLNTTKADSSFARGSVSVGSADSTEDLVDLTRGLGAVHLLLFYGVSCQVSSSGGLGIQSAIVAVDSGG